MCEREREREREKGRDTSETEWKKMTEWMPEGGREREQERERETVPVYQLFCLLKAKEIEICHVSNSYENDCQYKEFIDYLSSLHYTREFIMREPFTRAVLFRGHIAAFEFFHTTAKQK